MLELSHARKIDEAEWASADRVARLPMPEEAFFERVGPMPQTFASRRSFHRFYFPGQGILAWRDMSLGVYTTDISRKGLGMISPVQLFPMERATLRLCDGTECPLEVARCRRIGAECYECGCRFVVGRRVNEVLKER